MQADRGALTNVEKDYPDPPRALLKPIPGQSLRVPAPLQSFMYSISCGSAPPQPLALHPATAQLKAITTVVLTIPRCVLAQFSLPLQAVEGMYYPEAFSPQIEPLSSFSELPRIPASLLHLVRPEAHLFYQSVLLLASLKPSAPPS